MAFEATKREWSELYVFFRLLADGKVSLGTPQAKKEDEKCWQFHYKIFTFPSQIIGRLWL